MKNEYSSKRFGLIFLINLPIAYVLNQIISGVLESPLLQNIQSQGNDGQFAFVSLMASFFIYIPFIAFPINYIIWKLIALAKNNWLRTTPLERTLAIVLTPFPYIISMIFVLSAPLLLVVFIVYVILVVFILDSAVPKLFKWRKYLI